jgi:hypothetical protein
VPATARESAPSPAANANGSTGGPGLLLAPLRARDDRENRQPEARPELKDDRERRKDEEPWNGRGHLGGGAPSSLDSSLGAVNRSDIGGKRASIRTLLRKE